MQSARLEQVIEPPLKLLPSAGERGALLGSREEAFLGGRRDGHGCRGVVPYLGRRRAWLVWE